ncbi:Hypothetical predicted protein [Olea europaea subsp. europaea]|uniref:Uncharacterized protein n=1 Tax=Olea europaea subsp. europaea TaxID=158383 RepID=A0A8S0UTB3_OLEEU|nr:Hypothetical predicted protein [Olea europaea subsp. europaea]
MRRLVEEKKKKHFLVLVLALTRTKETNWLGYLSEIRLFLLKRRVREKGRRRSNLLEEREKRLVISRNEGPPPPPKRHTTIDELLKKSIEAKPISALKIIELEEMAKEKGGLLKRHRKKQSSRPSITEDKASSFLGDKSNEIASEVLEMLTAEVQSATRFCYKYWMEKYSNYAETCDAVDMMGTGLAMHAHSQGFFVNAEFERKTFEAVIDAQKLKNEVATVEEALEASKLKHADLESVVEQLTSANQDLTAEVHLC